jgi:ectoine hydroxylase-related dioxygenase (phytanoyl-CoA dioxygenase family)
MKTKGEPTGTAKAVETAKPDDTITRHVRNRRFSWESPQGPFRALTDEQAARYDRDGYVVFEDAFDTRQVEQLLAAIDPVEARREQWLRDQGGSFFIARAGEITFSIHLVLESDALRRLVGAPPLTDLCADLVGPDVRLYWDQAVYKKPHTTSPFPWHQDNGYAYVEPQQYLTCWIALSDADEENGCPWVVPGVHRTGTLAHRQTDVGLLCLDHPPDAVPVPARRGSIVVFSSLTPHCTGANVTDDVRKAYIVQYAPDGAEVVATDGQGRVTRTPAADPGRQFRVLEAGAPVPA